MIVVKYLEHGERKIKIKQHCKNQSQDILLNSKCYSSSYISYIILHKHTNIDYFTPNSHSRHYYSMDERWFTAKIYVLCLLDSYLEERLTSSVDAMKQKRRDIWSVTKKIVSRNYNLSWKGIQSIIVSKLIIRSCTII